MHGPTRIFRANITPFSLEVVRVAAVHKLVRGPTDHDDDPLLLEATRREVGRAAHRHLAVL